MIYWFTQHGERSEAKWKHPYAEEYVLYAYASIYIKSGKRCYGEKNQNSACVAELTGRDGRGLSGALTVF